MKYLLIIGLFFHLSSLRAQNNNLTYYVRYALENSPILEEYQNKMIINRIDSLIVLSDVKPSLHFSTLNTLAPIIDGFGYDQAITHKGRNSAFLSLRQTIIGQENLKNRLFTHTLDNRSLSNKKSITEQDLTLTITTQYIAAYGVMQEMFFSNEIIQHLEKEGEILKKMTEATLYKQTDYLNFYVALQKQKLLVNQQRAEYHNNLALLNYLCGITDTSYVQLEHPNILLLPTLSFENTLLSQNFILDSLKILHHSALINISNRPKLELFADAGFNSTLDNYTFKHFGASVGFSLTIPIFDGGRRQIENSKLKISEITRRYHQNFTSQQYRQQIAMLFQQLKETETIIHQAQSVIVSAQTLIEAYGKQLQTGDTSITDYLFSINNYMNAKHIITQQNINKMQIINQINYWNHEK